MLSHLIFIRICCGPPDKGASVLVPVVCKSFNSTDQFLHFGEGTIESPLRLWIPIAFGSDHKGSDYDIAISETGH